MTFLKRIKLRLRMRSLERQIRSADNAETRYREHAIHYAEVMQHLSLELVEVRRQLRSATPCRPTLGQIDTGRTA